LDASQPLRDNRKEFKNGILKLKGNRIAMTFEDWEVDKTPKNIRTSEHLEIQITVDKSAAFSMDRELKKAFLATTEVLPENLARSGNALCSARGSPHPETATSEEATPQELNPEATSWNLSPRT
jgi:hypothetical protein